MKGPFTASRSDALTVAVGFSPRDRSTPERIASRQRRLKQFESGKGTFERRSGPAAGSSVADATQPSLRLAAFRGLKPTATFGASLRDTLATILLSAAKPCFLLLLVPILFAGCQHTRPQFTAMSPAPANAVQLTPVTFTNRIDPAWLNPPAELFTLGPGDKLDIEFMGETNTLTTTVVGPDGKVYFNLLPGLDVWGLTLAQTKAQFERELAKYVRAQPQVSLVLRGVESKRIWVLGRVTEPGVFPLAAPMTVLEAISMAGGVMSMSSFRQQDVAGISDDLADLDRSFLLRQGKLLPIDFRRLLKQGDLSQNIYLEPGDLLYFPGAVVREVYVLGAVSQPRPVPYKEGLTVAGAVASAYGTITGAYLNHVAVVRGSLSNPQIAIVDYKKVIRGETSDIALQPRDIVYVPFSPYRYLQRYAQLIVDTFVSSAAINLSSSWIGQPIGGAGVFIPVGTGAPGTPAVAPPPIR